MTTIATVYDSIGNAVNPNDNKRVFSTEPWFILVGGKRLRQRHDKTTAGVFRSVHNGEPRVRYQFQCANARVDVLWHLDKSNPWMHLLSVRVYETEGRLPSGAGRLPSPIGRPAFGRGAEQQSLDASEPTLLLEEQV